MGRPSSLKRLVAADYPTEQRRLVNDLNPFLSSTSLALGGALTFDNMHAVVREFTVTAPALFTNVTTLGNLWTALYGPIGYAKSSDGMVTLRGVLTGGTYGSTAIFTLPAAYCPSVTNIFPVAQSSLFEPAGVLQIFPTGEVVAPAVTSVQTGSSTYLSLDGVSFEASDNSAPTPLSLNLTIGNLPQAGNLTVLSCLDVTSGTPVAAPFPAVAWQPAFVSGSPVAQIRSLVGLGADRRYKIRVVIYAF
jgi:hypothetical protein